MRLSKWYKNREETILLSFKETKYAFPTFFLEYIDKKSKKKQNGIVCIPIKANVDDVRKIIDMSLDLLPGHLKKLGINKVCQCIFLLHGTDKKNNEEYLRLVYDSSIIQREIRFHIVRFSDDEIVIGPRQMKSIGYKQGSLIDLIFE